MQVGIFSKSPFFWRMSIVLIIASMLLMWVDSKTPEYFSGLRAKSHAGMQPIYKMSSFYKMSILPNVTQYWGTDTLKTKESLRRENVRLTTQLIQAQAQLQKQDYLITQNIRLQGILSAETSDEHKLQLAQVIGIDTNPTKHIVVLNKGTEDGVKIGQTVIDENGIMGQILNVYENTSRLLLLSDEQLSVAVTIKRTGQRAIVSGNGDPKKLSLDFIFKTADLRLGDELISSGLGGRVPAGYRVGRIAKIDNQQKDKYFYIDVLPYANFIDNSYVLILQDKKDEKSNTKQPEKHNEKTSKQQSKKS